MVVDSLSTLKDCIVDHTSIGCTHDASKTTQGQKTAIIMCNVLPCRAFQLSPCPIISRGIFKT